MDTSFIKDLSVERGDNAEVTISGEIPYEILEAQKATAIEHLGKDVEIDGFRKGHVPENILEQHLGEMTILTEMAERALSTTYPEMLQTHEIEPIGYPQINITKLAPENPLGFTLTIAVMPDITLPDYKAIAKTQNENAESTEVTEEEVEKQINDILRQKVAYDRLQKKAAKQAEAPAEGADSDATDLPTPESEAAKTEESDEEDAPITSQEELDNLPLPELTDELVQGLGQPGQFENVEDFKQKLREHLAIEKEREVAANHRAKITDAIIETTEMAVPQVLVDAEINQMWAQMQDDLKKNELQMEDYLKHIDKTEEQLKEEWKPAAEKRAKLQLILNEIAQTEEITPDEQVVNDQVAQLKEQYPDADEAQVRTYVLSVLKNDAVMKMLEEQK